MQARTAGVLGVVATVSGALTTVLSIPSAWYGVEPTDAYVFDPAVLSPLWISRELVPILGTLAVLGLLAGLGGLVVRDWATAGRARRWGGVAALVGLAGMTAGAPSMLFGPSSTDPAGVIGFLFGFLAVLVGAGLLFVGLLLLGYGYVRTPVPILGYAMLGVAVGVPALSAVVPEPASSLVASLPVLVGWAVIGRDLRERSAPLDVA
jgi:hypothetical protein